MVSDCPFCQIISGDIAAPIVHEDDDIVCFLDHRPVFKGHVLVCTREHIVTLPEVPERLLVPLFSTVQRVADVIPRALGAQGTFVANNNVVSQSVAHLHVHVVPRTKGDGLRGFFWPRVKYGDGEAAEYAERLGAALADQDVR
ncbi:MAG: HIT family protein [Nocardioidaceae bacterium]